MDKATLPRTAPDERSWLGRKAEKLKTSMAVIMLGSLALVGCGNVNSSEHEQLPKISSELIVPQATDASEIVDTAKLLRGEVPKNEYQELKGRQGSIEQDPSAPFYTITYEDGALRYDAIHELYPASEQNLLGAIYENRELLEAAFKNGDMKHIYFRLLEPDNLQSRMVYSRHDPTAADKSGAIYYFLPAGQQIDNKSISTMLSHEAFHSLLGHGEPWLTDADDRQKFTQVCVALRDTALKEMSATFGSIASNMQFLRDSAPSEFQPAFDGVIEALENDTYANLDGLGNYDGAGIKECYMKYPLEAVYAMAEKMGLNVEALTNAIASSDVSDAIDEINVEWKEALDDSIIGQVTEGTYLAPTDDNEHLGHPDAGTEELEVAAVNLLYQVATVPFAARLSTQTQDEQLVVLKVMSLGINQLSRRGDIQGVVDLLVKKHNALAERLGLR